VNGRLPSGGLGSNGSRAVAFMLNLACASVLGKLRAGQIVALKTLKPTPSAALKADLPPTKWGKVLGATPVVLTVLATMLAGLASSEMTTAQYDRALAAQQQSKAGDQWNFFQGKKLRSGLQHSTLDTIVSAGDVPPLEVTTLRQAIAATPAAAALDSIVGAATLAALMEGTLPAGAPVPARDVGIQAALEALDQSRPDADLNAILVPVSDATLENELRIARGQSLEFDGLMKPLAQTVDVLEQQVLRGAGNAGLKRAFTVARLHFHALRYDAEARLNQLIAGLYELQVHKSNLSAERHHRRSQRFFYGMLAAQMGVIISTLAMAARKRNLLWAIAAGAGLVAISVAIYVYLYV
jgi:hypothetical protein